MALELKTIPPQSFGSNIHFVYDLEKTELLFLHPNFDWAVSSKDVKTELASKISAEDLPDALRAYQQTIDEQLQGSFIIKLNATGRKRWIQICPFIARYGSSNVLLGSLMEVSDQVANTESMVRYANKKNSILHMLAHDLRGPLNMAKSIVKIVDREVSDIGLRNKTSYIAGILQQSIDLISDLVAREFLETTEVALAKKRVEVVEEVREYLEECKRSEDLAQRRFSLESSHEKIFIELDVAKFMQIINNLMSNSLKFTSSGGEIRVQITDEEDQVKFDFSDDGIGIPKEQLPKIFEKFTEARRPGLNGEPTLGLGLSIVKTIIEWHGGNIWCDSKEGIGSNFHFTIPKTSI